MSARLLLDAGVGVGTEAEEVLERQPESVRSFVLETSDPALAALGERNLLEAASGKNE